MSTFPVGLDNRMSDRDITAKSLIGAKFQFMQAFSWYPPICDITTCTCRALNFYQLSDGKGIALCNDHDYLLVEDVKELSPYPGQVRQLPIESTKVKEVEKKLDGE